jgi:gluconate kinase
MKIIIIRGKSGAGKSTISHELAKALPNYIFIDIWKIKEMFEPLNSKDRKGQNEICKDAISFILKRAIKDKVTDKFMLQEIRNGAIRKALRNYLNKEDKIYSFFLDVNLETALKRNIEREKETMPEKYFKEQAKEGLKNKDNEDVLIDTSDKTIDQVLDIILNETCEKRKKNPNAGLIRRTK